MYLPSSMLSGYLCLIVSLNKCECIIGLMQYELAVHQQQQHKTDNVYMWQLLSLFNFTRDKQYGIYYPPRQLAVYIPTYFVLLFFCIPIMYMGLNMLCAPNLDDVDAVWDTMSNEDLQVAESTKHIIDSQSNSENIGVAIPSICDLDVRELHQVLSSVPAKYQIMIGNMQLCNLMQHATSCNMKQKQMPKTPRGPNVLIMSGAGKPIFVRYSNNNRVPTETEDVIDDEDEWATVCSLIQAIRANVLSFSLDTDEAAPLGDVQFMKAGRKMFMFMNTEALTLVAIGDEEYDTEFLRLHLEYAYAQIIFTLTNQVNTIFGRSANYDLRTMMGPNVNASLRNLLDLFDPITVSRNVDGGCNSECSGVMDRSSLLP
eukprot:scaffold19369_cov59-Cyclotella_meneghiniana.AAC.1